jgi:hypothetical protein
MVEMEPLLGSANRPSGIFEVAGGKVSKRDCLSGDSHRCVPFPSAQNIQFKIERLSYRHPLDAYYACTSSANTWLVSVDSGNLSSVPA